MSFISTKKDFLDKYTSYGYSTDKELLIDTIHTEEFPHLKGTVYLDHAGATIYAKSQLNKIHEQMLTGLYGNPHSKAPGSEDTRIQIANIRRQVLDFFHTNENEYELIFTSGATGSLKIIGECFPWTQESTFAYSMDSHTSVLGIRQYAAGLHATCECISLDQMKQLAMNATASHSSIPSESESVSSITKKHDQVNLFAFPAECNFSGTQYPLEIISFIQSHGLFDKNKGKWFVLLDAAKYVTTNELDLSKYQPDLMVFSFYKMFGYPTGLGALLINKKRQSSIVSFLKKKYYGGGTVDNILASQNFVVLKKTTLAEQFSDGTQSFLSILAIKPGLEMLSRLGGMKAISAHCSSLRHFVVTCLKEFHHWNGKKVCEIYESTFFSSFKSKKGSIVACNFRRADGSYVGYAEVNKLASIHGIHLRTGCFCNPGACQAYLELEETTLLSNMEAGHVCGDEMDLIDGKPTGAVRISIGYMTTYEDIQHLLGFVQKYFVLSLPILSTKLNFVTTHRINTTNQLKIRKITLFPIKSCAGMFVQAWPMGPRGLLFDREWAIVDTNTKKTFSQKEIPELCFVSTCIDLKRQVLQISFKDKKDFVEVSFYQTQTEKEDDDKSIDMNICMSVCKGNNVGDAKVSTWLSEKLGRSCLLMRVSQLHQRDSQANLTKHQIRQLVKEDDSKFSMAAGEAATSAAAKIGFANQAQYLLISSASIDHLNMILQELHCHEGVSEEVFRANFIVEGCQAFEEDTWQSITIGGHVFEVSGPCSRCSMININQKTGTFNREPLQALSTYRRERANIYFGQFLTAKQPTSTQWLQVDDPIRIEQLKYSNI